jgi:hypothetical protein
MIPMGFLSLSMLPNIHGGQQTLHLHHCYVKGLGMHTPGMSRRLHDTCNLKCSSWLDLVCVYKEGGDTRVQQGMQQGR